MFFRRLHGADLGHVRGVGAVLLEHFLEQAGVAGAVFDNQQHDPFIRGHAHHSACGNLAFLNQKSLMLPTTLSNLSSWTGLLR